MKVVVTGSLGNISKPLVIKLVENGHHVIVVSHNTDRKKQIEELGAHAAIGRMDDIPFMVNTVGGADVLYAMETLGDNFFFNKRLNFMDGILAIAKAYKETIIQAGIKNVIHLSSIGAHTDCGNGMLALHHAAEAIFNSLPVDVSIKFMRPVGFYINMFAFIPSIRRENVIVQNYGGNEKEPWVSPKDIADVIAEEIGRPFNGRTIRYIASDEVSPVEVARALGAAIGKPDLQWITVSDEQMFEGLLAAGMNTDVAKGLVEMNAGRRTGVLYEDYYRNRPVLGRVKLNDFAKEFSKVYGAN